MARTTGTGGGAHGALVNRAGQATVHIEGLTHLQKTLTKVMPREARNILRRTVVAVAKEMRDDMREHVRTNSEDSGTLRKAIRSRREKGRSRDQQEAAVWITHGKGQKNDAYYWHMVEWGTVKTPEKPFIRPTVKVWEGKIGTVFEREFGTQFEKEMAKRSKK